MSTVVILCHRSASVPAMHDIFCVCSAPKSTMQTRRVKWRYMAQVTIPLPLVCIAFHMKLLKCHLLISGQGYGSVMW